MGLNFENSMGPWTLTVKEQVGVGGWEMTKRKPQRGGGLWLN